jgi:hypothetical protein
LNTAHCRSTGCECKLFLRQRTANHDRTNPVSANDQGEKIAVVIGSEEYEKLLDDLEELRAIREYHEAKAAGETPIPFGSEEATARIEQKRNRT